MNFFAATVLAIAFSALSVFAQPALPQNSSGTNQMSKSRREAAELADSTRTTNVAASDPIEQDYEKLLDEDDKAREEVDTWIQNNQKFAKEGAGEPIRGRKRLARESGEG